MKIFAKQPRNDQNPQNALPGVFVLFDRTNAAILKERMLFAGYAAWTLFPPLFTFGLSFLSLSSVWTLVTADAVLVLHIAMSTWVSACLTLLGLSRLRSQPLHEKDIESRARKAMPLLLYLFAFSFFCITLGTYALILPGIIALVWLAFADVIAIDEPGIRFNAAIAQSRALSRGRFFQVFWRISAGNALFGLAYIILALVVLGTIFSLANIDTQALINTLLFPNSKPPAWIPLLLHALFLPLLPYVTVYNAALYDALKKA